MRMRKILMLIISVRGCSYGGELARLTGLARLAEIWLLLKNFYKTDITHIAAQKLLICFLVSSLLLLVIYLSLTTYNSKNRLAFKINIMLI